MENANVIGALYSSIYWNSITIFNYIMDNYTLKDRRVIDNVIFIFSHYSYRPKMEIIFKEKYFKKY
jgi:hypothetical protein